MWEEPLNHVKVLHRRLPDAPDKDEEGMEYRSDNDDDEWEVVETPDHGDTLKTSSESDELQLKKSKRSFSIPRTRPESIDVRMDNTNLKLVLNTWGKPFERSQQTPPKSSIYALLSAEKPFFKRKAKTIAQRMIKTSGGTPNTLPIRWDKPDFMVLYGFNSLSEYDKLAESIKDGRLWNVLQYRAVSLEPVRVIDSSLKMSVEVSFPIEYAALLRQQLSSLFAPIPIAQQFVFLPTLIPFYQNHLDDSPVGSIPSTIISFVTSSHMNYSYREISKTFELTTWVSMVEIGSVSITTQNWGKWYQHHEYNYLLPVMSLVSIPAHIGLEDGIRVTVLCVTHYESTVSFYKTILTNPVQTDSHTIFSLMTNPTSNLELYVYNTPTLKTYTLPSLTLHFYVSDMVAMAIKLTTVCSSVLENISDGKWLTQDPQGNTVILHDKERITALL